jgi:putative PIN family toxin of toxin-antitoxin system
MVLKNHRIILDTNIWISYLITKNHSLLDELLINQQITILFSEELLNEFFEVINRPKLKKYFKQKDLEVILELIENYGELIEVKSKIEICRDYKDNFLLSLAVDGKANYLISGDADLLVLKKIKKTKIISLKEFYLMFN